MVIKRGNQGFHLGIILVLVSVLAIVALLIWKFVGTTIDSEKSALNNNFVTWDFDGNNWKPSNTPPSCEDPIQIKSPVDINKVNSVLLPGQVRGSDFKPHGGLATDMQSNNDMIVSTVRDAYLYRGSRYISFGEVQYMFDFIDPCGIMFRLDHLNNLSDEFQRYADKLPTPQPDDSRTVRFDEQPWISSGTVVATTIGIKNDLNTFFDFGVYDLRKRNAASTTDLYKQDKLRLDDKEMSFYAICWFNNLPEPDRSKVLSYPERDGARTGRSDYCTEWR